MATRDPDLLLWAGALSAAAAILLLRFAWGRAGRSAPLNGGAWALLVAGLIAGAAKAGAWGIAMVSVTAVLTALACLAQAAATAPAGKARTTDRRAAMPAPDTMPTPTKAPLRLGSRLLTFALIMPGTLIASLALGIAARALAGIAGAHEADGNVLTLFLMPILWAGLSMAVLMIPRRRTQWLVIGVPALAGLSIVAATVLTA